MKRKLYILLSAGLYECLRLRIEYLLPTNCLRRYLEWEVLTWQNSIHFSWQNLAHLFWQTTYVYFGRHLVSSCELGRHIF